MKYLLTKLCLLLSFFAMNGQSQPVDSAQFYLDFGDSLYFQSDYPKAQSALLHGLQLATHAETKTKLLNSLGNVLTYSGKKDEALGYYHEALRSARTTDNVQKFEALVNKNISALYQESSDYKMAFEYMAKAEAAGELLNDSLFRGDLYNNKGLLLEYMDSLQQAVDSYLRAYAIFEKLNVDERMSLCANNLGVVYKNMGQNEKAIFYYDISLQKAKQIGHDFLIAANYINLGNLLTKMHRFDEAKSNYDDGLSLSRKIGQPDLVRECLQGLADFYEEKGDYKSALVYQKQFQALTDSLLNTQRIETVAELETRFGLEKKELELESLAIENQKKQLYIVLLLLACVLLIGGIAVGMRINSLRRHKRELELVALTEKQERDRIAQDLHDELGSGISRINWITSGAKVNSKSEDDIQRYTHIEDIASQLSVSMKSLIWLLYSGNCTLEALSGRIREMAGQHADDFGYELEFSSKGDETIILQQNAARDLFLMIKECVNNVSKHASASQLTIRCERDGDTLKWTIQDDGKGFDMNNPKHGHGLYNLKKRVSMWNGTVDTQSQPGFGTTINICVPVSHVEVESETKLSA